MFCKVVSHSSAAISPSTGQDRMGGHSGKTASSLAHQPPRRHAAWQGAAGMPGWGKTSAGKQEIPARHTGSHVHPSLGSMQRMSAEGRVGGAMVFCYLCVAVLISRRWKRSGFLLYCLHVLGEKHNFAAIYSDNSIRYLKNKGK